jgi:two-component sensor histidine kinase
MNYIWQQKSLEIKTCPGNPKDKIAVVLPARGEEAALSVSDTDTGFPESVDFGTTGLPGSPLIVQLVKQVGGSVEMPSCDGTTLIAAFPVVA